MITAHSAYSWLGTRFRLDLYYPNSTCFGFAVVATIMSPTYEGYVEKSESVVIGTPSQSQ